MPEVLIYTMSAWVCLASSKVRSSVDVNLNPGSTVCWLCGRGPVPRSLSSLSPLALRGGNHSPRFIRTGEENAVGWRHLTVSEPPQKWLFVLDEELMSRTFFIKLFCGQTFNTCSTLEFHPPVGVGGRGEGCAKAAASGCLATGNPSR